jgi:hypothetical protein
MQMGPGDTGTGVSAILKTSIGIEGHGSREPLRMIGNIRKRCQTRGGGIVRLKIILRVLYSTFNNTVHFHVWTHVSDLTERIGG